MTGSCKRKTEMVKFKVNGKIYPHYRKHKPNARQVKREVTNNHMKERLGRYMTKDEASMFHQGFNNGWNEAKKHSKKLLESSSEIEKGKVKK